MYHTEKMRKFWVDNSGIKYSETKIKKTNKLNTEINTAKIYLMSFCKKIKGKGKGLSSYGLKHNAERFGQKVNKETKKTILSSYVSNGSLIIAAIELGYTIYKYDESLNCSFNLSVKK